MGPAVRVGNARTIAWTASATISCLAIGHYERYRRARDESEEVVSSRM